MKPTQLSALILSIFLVSCGGQHSQTQMETKHQNTASIQSAPVATMETASASAPSSVDLANSEHNSIHALNTIVSHAQPTHRPFMITADLVFRTDDVRKTAVAIEQLAVQQGGFVVSNQTNSHIVAKEVFKQNNGMLLNIERYQSSAELTIRIPREKAQVFLHGLQTHMTLLEQHHYQAQDVATTLQREILTAQREYDKSQALQQLNQQSKHNPHADRAQMIDSQFTARERQDEAKIQQAEWQDKVDYATISLRFHQPENVIQSLTADAQAMAAKYRPPFWESVGQSLKESIYWLLELFLFGLKTWFVWLGLGALWFLWRKDFGQNPNKNPNKNDIDNGLDKD